MNEAGPAGSGRREVIVARAAELLARKGIAGTTVREIGEAVGILSGSIYHHFESKDAIVDVLMSAYLQELQAQYRAVLDRAADVSATFDGLVHASLRTIELHPHATLIYQHEAQYFRETPRYRYVRVAGERVRETWMGVLEAAVADGVFRADLPTRHLYLLLRDGLWLSVRWFRPTAGYGYPQLATDCARLYHQAFASQSTLRRMIAQP
jgi:TetR/AcrR family transcriptional regulator, cholesterol catabolism regulator